MEPYIRISTLNDFLFCPKSIYFHQLYEPLEKNIYQDTPQLKGTHAHTTIDKKDYSTSKEVLQGTAVFSEKYHLTGKIDLFHIGKKTLMERKKHISRVYQGQIYQLYGQYFCLLEMGYEVKKLKLYSMDDNKVYEIPIPDKQEVQKFEKFIEDFWHFDPAKADFQANPKKCAKCIYAELCDSVCKE